MFGGVCQTTQHGAGPTSSSDGGERIVIALGDVEGPPCKGGDECPNDSTAAGNYGNLQARPAKIGAQRHNTHGGHRNGRGTIGKIDT